TNRDCPATEVECEYVCGPTCLLDAKHGLDRPMTFRDYFILQREAYRSVEIPTWQELKARLEAK
ncbi:MAG: hypothetical protein OK436_04200, partial [Thaumarchaeota archaeon]|nr:hypothetical protein [Nitrososphaerota archaeon]